MTLYIQFCDGTVAIQCTEPTLYHQLARYFHHCRGTEVAGAITYRITSTEKNPTKIGSEGLQLWREDELLHPDPSSLYIFTYLMQQVMNALIKQCRSALVFHAAGIVRNGQGIMLCARSGGGKSTIASWATATGFDFLSDEVIAVNLDALEMRGIT